MLLCVVAPASATSIFARQYGFSCERCHTIVPELNTFGQNFKINGYRIAGKPVAHTLPLSSSVLTTYESGGSGSRAHVGVDEWRLQSGGALGPALTYYIEQYVIDGGAPGSLDQAWVQYDSNTAHPTAKTDIRVRAGSQYLPLPVYADTYRPTLSPYGIFDQTVGQNAFALGDKYTGVDIAAGSDYDAMGIHAFLSANGIALFAHHTIGNVNLSAYRISGQSRVMQTADAFWREALAATVGSKTFEWTSALQTGYDSNPEGIGTAQSSGGGFTQLQWFPSNGVMAVARWDETFAGAAAERSLTSALVFHLSENGRLTLEDVLQGGNLSFHSGLLLGL
jgi:hypothetical protein